MKYNSREFIEMVRAHIGEYPKTKFYFQVREGFICKNKNKAGKDLILTFNDLLRVQIIDVSQKCFPKKWEKIGRDVATVDDENELKKILDFLTEINKIKDIDININNAAEELIYSFNNKKYSFHDLINKLKINENVLEDYKAKGIIHVPQSKDEKYYSEFDVLKIKIASTIGADITIKIEKSADEIAEKFLTIAVARKKANRNLVNYNHEQHDIQSNMMCEPNGEYNSLGNEPTIRVRSTTRLNITDSIDKLKENYVSPELLGLKIISKFKQQKLKRLKKRVIVKLEEVLKK